MKLSGVVGSQIGRFSPKVASLLLLLGTLPMYGVAPGVTLLDVNRDPALFEVLESAADPIISPDGKHLYLGRFAAQENGTIAVFGLRSDGINRPFFIELYKTGAEGQAELTGYNLTIRQFSADGTRAYATFGQPGTSAHHFSLFGISVLARNTQTGSLTELQTITMPEGTSVGSPVISADDKHLYVSTAVANPNVAGDTELRRYSLHADTGLLEDVVSLAIPRADQLSFLRLIDNGRALLASSSTELVEYRRDTTSGELSLQSRYSLPPLLVLHPDNPISDPGPVATAITADGQTVYSLRAGLVSRGGGYLNTLRRDSGTGTLTLIDELTPLDFPDNFLFRSQQILLSDAEEIALVPSYHGRFIAGSPSLSACINAFAVESDSGALRPTGTNCESSATGASWAAHPQSNRFYSNWYTFRNPFAPDVVAPGSIAVWEPGRIVLPTTIHAAILPLSRSIGERETNSEPATYFTSIINAGDVDAERCTIIYDGNAFVRVGFQLNEPATNKPLDDTVSFSFLGDQFDIPAGTVRQLTLSVFQENEFGTTAIELDYRCLNSPDAPRVAGVNNLLVASSRLPLPDLVTGAVTQGNSGIARLPSSVGTTAFAVSTINIGAADELTARPVFDLALTLGDTSAGTGVGTGTINAGMRICETNPDTGACLADPTTEVTRRIANQEIATYTVFVDGGGSEIAFAPARNRAFIVLVDSMGEVRGASSVAITTAP